MNRRETNRIWGLVPIALSVTACVWVLGNVAGGVRRLGDEGLGFHVFWLLIVLQVPFLVGYFATAEWQRRNRVATRLAVIAMGLILAFFPVAYFKL